MIFWYTDSRKKQEVVCRLQALLLFFFFHDKMFALKFTIPKKFILNKLFHVKTRFMYM